MTSVAITGDYLRELMAVERQAALLRKKTVPAAVQQRAAEENLRAAFNVFDSEGSGTVKRMELDLLMRSAGLTLTTEQINEALTGTLKVDAAVETITLPQFIELVRVTSKPRDSKEESKRVFQMFADKSTTGATSTAAAADATAASSISVDVLRQALLDVDARISDEELQEVVKYCGLSGKTGEITEADWLEVTAFVNELGW
jgi:Ca2+-binding EF-hand superfamily protein